MLAPPQKEMAVKRDLDLIRDLLLYLEALPVPPSSTYTVPVADIATALRSHDPRKIAHHLEMLIDSGLLIVVGKGLGGHDELMFHRISWVGHDFIDCVRHPDVWYKTKLAAEHAGGWTFDLVFELGKAYVKRNIAEATEIEL